jgi:holliday junction DNA helicase RuvA
MIAQLNGKLLHKEPGMIIIDCQGVGYEVRVSMNTYSRLPDTEHCRIHTILIVREDAHLLYGFADVLEKSLFQLLISISGVGPNTALMVLSSLSPDELQQAILEGNEVLIRSIKGVGPKTAQRIILELKDKVQKTNTSTISLSKTVGSHTKASQEALSALLMLGIARNVAQQSIEKILKAEGEQLSVEEIIKKALKTP